MSKETKDMEKERIHFFEVTERYAQIAAIVASVLSAPNSEFALDFKLLHDFCLEAISTFVSQMEKNSNFERVIIQESLDVWSACLINSQGPIAWQRA